jgi:hypothetical protein
MIQKVKILTKVVKFNVEKKKTYDGLDKINGINFHNKQKSQPTCQSSQGNTIHYNTSLSQRMPLKSVSSQKLKNESMYSIYGLKDPIKKIINKEKQINPINEKEPVYSIKKNESKSNQKSKPTPQPLQSKEIHFKKVKYESIYSIYGLVGPKQELKQKENETFINFLGIEVVDPQSYMKRYEHFVTASELPHEILNIKAPEGEVYANDWNSKKWLFKMEKPKN